MLPVSKSKGRAILGEAAAAEEVKCVGEGGNLITSFHTQIAHWFLFFAFLIRGKNAHFILVNKG